jgi:undecaprenyl-diphosphatase
MHLIQAAVLGIAQGLTEFLPVSSSAHLILMRDVLEWRLLNDPHWNMVFDVSVHGGTFAALVGYFWADIGRLAKAFFASFGGGIAGIPERKLAWTIVVATIPAAVGGYLGEQAIEASLRQAPMIVAALLLVFGLILWQAEQRGRKTKSLDETGWLDGVLIGCAQTVSLAPGVSRSGITMTIGLARGMTREAAARFSFLLSIPIIAGAALYGLRDVVGGASALPQGALAMFGVGFVSAAISGYLCIRYFLRYLQSHALAPFIIYRVAMGAFLLVWFAVK